MPMSRLTDVRPLAAFQHLATPNSWNRGEAYARQGRVTILRHDRADGEIVAQCLGSRGKRYRLSVGYDYGPDGELAWIDGECTCPVGYNCKHCVAAALVALDLMDEPSPFPTAQPQQKQKTRQPQEPAWRRELDRIFVPAANPLAPDDELSQIGLMIAFVPDPKPAKNQSTVNGAIFVGGRLIYPTSSARRSGLLQAQPVRPGKAKKWVRGTMSWYRFQDGERTSDPAQVAALEALRRLYSGEGGYLGSQQEPLPLNLINSQGLWPVLRQIVDSGVALIEKDTFRPVVLEEEPASADIQIRQDTDGGLDLDAAIHHPEMRGRPTMTRIGTPVHGVCWRNRDGLHLAPLNRPAGASWSRLAGEPEALHLPPEGREAFVTEVLPRLEQMGWTSPDGSFIPPDPPAPSLHLELGVSSGDGRTPAEGSAVPRALRRWGWHYRDEQGRGRGPLPLTSGRTGAGRDAEEEKRIAASVAAELTGLDVVRLLQEAVQRLEKLGVVIESAELPDFHRTSDPQIQIGVDHEGGNDWLDLEISVDVDGHTLPLANLIRALTLHEEALFLPDGSYLMLDNPELDRLRALLAEAAELGDQRRDGVQVPTVRVSWWEELLALGIVQTSEDAWFSTLRKALGAPPAPAEIPDGLNAKLRPYQEDGYRWLAGLRRAGLGGVLADDMGLGKTVQALAMVLDEREHPGPEAAGPADSGVPDPRPAWLVVAPTSVVGNWASEAERFAPSLRVETIESTAVRRDRSLAEIASGADVVITSYALLRMEADDYAALPWSGMLLDEAQNTKNHTSKVFAAIMRIDAQVRYAITGTPMENNLGELWAMFALTAPGLLGSPKQFQAAFRRPIERSEDDAGDRMAVLRRRIAPFLLRRTKDQIALDLPPKQEQIIHVELAPAHRRVYERQLQHERQRVLQLTDDIDHNQIEVLAALTRLRQLAIDPTLVDQGEKATKAPSSKLDALVPLLVEAAEEGHRVLVFSQFTRYLRKIAGRLEHEGIGYSYLDGATPHRGAVIKGFTGGADPVFLISLKAGGSGINLTQADYAILADPWWNPAAESQAVDRAHRIGQTRPVHVYRMVSRDTIEEKVLALQDAKRKLISGVLDAGPGATATGGSRLTADDVRLLLS